MLLRSDPAWEISRCFHVTDISLLYRERQRQNPELRSQEKRENTEFMRKKEIENRRKKTRGSLITPPAPLNLKRGDCWRVFVDSVVSFCCIPLWGQEGVRGS
jgi:hypothetical protein